MMITPPQSTPAGIPEEWTGISIMGPQPHSKRELIYFCYGRLLHEINRGRTHEGTKR